MNKVADDILCNFINIIGYDGEYFRKFLDCKVIYNCPLLGYDGEYLTPNSKRYFHELDRNNLKDEEERGLIYINKDIRDDELNETLTLIHEKIHSVRTILTKDGYFDANQDIIHDNVYDEDKLYKQRVVDEALVELITLLSYKMRNNNNDIYSSLKVIKDIPFIGNDIKIMSKIILRHHDLELIKWMVDPISYSLGDTKYDFFDVYTKNDTDLVDELMESDLDIDVVDLYFKKSK